RFGNRALGDTVHRVGRDLPRKLGRDDRIVGAMLLCARHGLRFDAIAAAYRAALGFDCPDESGALTPADRDFLSDAADRGARWALTTVSSLDPADPVDARVIAAVVAGGADVADV
ncbi:MAG: mannitol-1-phosphate 5-dehydrogenase, partial [Spirochaetaceae bacterium]